MVLERTRTHTHFYDHLVVWLLCMYQFIKVTWVNELPMIIDQQGLQDLHYFYKRMVITEKDFSTGQW